MANIGRRGFVKDATLVALAFGAGGAEVIMAPGEARARDGVAIGHAGELMLSGLPPL